MFDERREEVEEFEKDVLRKEQLEKAYLQNRR